MNILKTFKRRGETKRARHSIAIANRINEERQSNMKLAEKLKNSTDDTEFTNEELKKIADTIKRIWDDGEDDEEFLRWLEEEDEKDNNPKQP